MKNCAECGKPVDLSPGDAIEGAGIIGENADTLCRACMTKGWSEATPQDFINDPSFTVAYESPIQRKDL